MARRSGRDGDRSADERGAAALPGGRDRLPPLNALRAFEAVARHASMRRAAEDLSVCHTVVSRHVRSLEAWFGLHLVESGSRGVRLTEEGERLHAGIARAFDDIAAVTADLRPRLGRGSIRVWCVPGLAARWLTTRLADLQAALPGVEIVLRATVERPDFDLGEADAEIRYGHGRPDRGRSELLEHSRLFPVASPGWVASHPPVTGLSDLAGRRLIHEDSRDQWRRWFAALGHEPVGDLAGPRLWYASSALDAAAAGQGVALATRLQAADDIGDGRLVELLATDVSLGDYWFTAAESRWSDPAIVRLRQWFAAAVAATAAAVRPGERGGEA